MAVRILRRPKVASDAEAIADWIAQDNLDAALRFLANLQTTLEQLAEFPSSGSPYHVDIPELANLRIARVVGFPKHIIFYIEHVAAIEVIRILHGARDVDSELRRAQ